ncbi:hypothetical protein [Belliella aquatica]|uniref:DUF3592 domain-containing protein n=1 Tax=Belliella aquatica TaxID=1323734 RepID=A0ABQ1MVD9_9BACT|nr:hypothetical protein [Belliella aquatica]MCH7406670.1 hypothetical protein [Belliella aquatica]GGC47569.1 hypothetical protein GCM10010993_27630 [Belliella aquatica]
MEAAKKKIRSLLIKMVLIICVLVVFDNYWKKYYNILEKRYVIREVLRIHPLLKQGVQVEYQFSISGKYYIKSWPREYFSPKIGQNYIVEVPIFRKKNSKILLDHQAPDTIKSPFDGWKEIPEYLKPK